MMARESIDFARSDELLTLGDRKNSLQHDGLVFQSRKGVFKHPQRQYHRDQQS